MKKVIIVLMIGIICFPIVGMIMQPRDVILKETSTEYVTKQYSFFGCDSTIVVRKKPVVHNGIVNRTYTTSRYVNRMLHTYYHVVVNCSVKTFDVECSYSEYITINKGQKIKVVENFYTYDGRYFFDEYSVNVDLTK